MFDRFVHFDKYYISTIMVSSTCQLQVPDLGEFEGCYSKICLWNSTAFSTLEQLKSEDTWNDTWKAISLHVMMCRFYVNMPLLAVVELGLVYKLNFDPGTRFAF